MDSTFLLAAGTSAAAVVAGAVVSAAALEAVPLEMWKGKEYWKTSGLES